MVPKRRPRRGEVVSGSPHGRCLVRVERLVDRLVYHEDMRTIGAFEAKTHLAQILDLVAAGERVTITRRGNPVAMLVPVSEGPALTPEEAASALRRLRRGVTLGDIAVRELIDEGRP